MIQLQGINKTFRNEFETVEILRDIDLRIPKGEWVSIVGPSGSGKTTLLNCMTGLLEPTSGTVYYDKTDIYHLNDKRRSDFRLKNIGFVFQDFKLLPYYSVMENIIMPLVHTQSKTELYKRAKMLLEKVGIGKGIHSRLPGALSGGEKQRVAIARSLIANPEVIVCDEPTGNLDIKNRERLISLFHDLHGDQKTIVMVTHDMEIASHADDVFYLNEGSLVRRQGVS